MRWHRDSITAGEIDALHKAAQRAWGEDTRYPLANGTGDSGQCYVTAYWLKQRLGGEIGRFKGHYAWLSPDNDYVLDLAPHEGDVVYEENTEFRPIASVPSARTERFVKRADEIFDHLSKVLHLSLDYAGDGLPAEEPQRSSELSQEEQYWHDEPTWKPATGEYQFVYCNPGDSPIWMSDLSFKRIANIKVGDKVVGWESSGSMSRRKLRESTVLEIFTRKAEVVEVTFESGRKISCTADHRWLRHWSQGASNSGEQFVIPAPGELLTHVIDVDKAHPILHTRYSRDAAWLGGIFDGEGSVQTTIKLSQCPERNHMVRERIKYSLDRLGFEYTDGGVKDIWLKGGREEFVKFANWTNPVWRDKIAKLVLGERWQTPDRIVSVESKGTDTVYGMKTTTGNYIAWGYASKNCNGQLEVSPFHDHDQLLAHTGVGKDHQGPMAMGHIVLRDNKGTWQVASNMNLKGLDRIFKDYTKHVGWGWGGMTNLDGEPVSDDFAPKHSFALSWIYDANEDHLYLGSNTVAGLAIRSGSLHNSSGDRGIRSGAITVEGRRATVSGEYASAPRSLKGLYDFCEDRGLVLYAGNDNQLKVIPDLQQDNFYDPNPNNPDEHQYPEGPADEREPSGVYRCPVCNRLFPGWDEYADHRREEANDKGGEAEYSGGFPENNMDATFPTHFTEQQPFGITTGAVMAVPRSEAERVDGYASEAARDGDQFFVLYRNGSPIAYSRIRDGKLSNSKATSHPDLRLLEAKVVKYTEKQPKDLLPAPLPFIYDIHDDEITIGQPGQRTSDIPGQFTPGGIIEGIYEPGGKVIIKTMTNTPYSVRHVIDLWYYQHPELSVTSMYLQDAAGKATKLASEDVGGYIKSLVGSEPAVHSATKALEATGGKVYAVGGAVRDALLGQEPKDIDLMVTGLKPAEVQDALGQLPGKTNLTGKDFGVFRYKDGGDEVEIALPRRDRSTGAGHRDFNVQADPHMRPEEDLWRRDFTANAMAVDLSNGRLVDPYGGADDTKRGILRAHNSEALGEDPLRVVRGLVANARHGLVPDDATKDQMAAAAPSLTHLPPERIQAELDKLFAAKDPASAIRLAHETGTLNSILPEVEETMGYDQNNPHHEYMLGDHLVNVLDRAAEKTADPDVRLAALLHDIGKPGSQWTDPDTGSSHFYKKKLPDGSFIGEDHAELGARMTTALMNRLRYPRDRTQRVTELVRHHMFPAFTSQKGARKFINRVGDHADDLLDMRWADQGGKSEYPSNAKTGLDLSVDTQRKLLEQVRNQQQPTNQSQLAVNGNDLIQAGISAGPQLGAILQRLTEAVVENPDLNTKDQLLNLAKNVTSTEQVA